MPIEVRYGNTFFLITKCGRVCYKHIKKTLVFWRGFTILVELSGIEPLTSCMPCKRSPSWAIAPHVTLLTALCWVQSLVELSGIEPLTSCMPCKRSPSWAIAPSRKACRVDGRHHMNSARMCQRQIATCSFNRWKIRQMNNFGKPLAFSSYSCHGFL